MPRTRTLLELRTEARQRTEMELSDFITTAELNRYINQSIAKLYGKLVKARGDQYYRTSSDVIIGPDTITTTYVDELTPTSFITGGGAIGSYMINGDFATPPTFAETGPYYVQLYSLSGSYSEVAIVDHTNGVDEMWFTDPLTQAFDGDGDNVFLTTRVDTTVTHPCTLPTDFFKLLGVDVQVNGIWRSIEPLDWSRREAYLNSSGVLSAYSDIAYSIEGPIIRMYPAQTSIYTVKLWYIPYATVLTADTDTFDGINGWEHYVVLDTAISMLAKEESDTRPLWAERAIIEEQIDELSSTRDEGAPWRIERRYKTSGGGLRSFSRGGRR